MVKNIIAVVVSLVLAVALSSIILGSFGVLIFFGPLGSSLSKEQIIVILFSGVSAGVVLADLAGWLISRNWWVVIITTGITVILFMLPFIGLVSTR